MSTTNTMSAATIGHRAAPRIVAVASGKGGTGKTTVAVNLALALAAHPGMRVTLLDCDVEEPNAHLFLRPQFDAALSNQPVTIPTPEVDAARCTACGRCAEVCAYHAIAVLGGHMLTFPELCHGCGGCAKLCPEHAITEVPQHIGSISQGLVSRGEAGTVHFAHGVLDIGCALAPPIINAVRSSAPRTVATDAATDDSSTGNVTIIDSPPGTSCTAVASIRGADFCVLVTEPTPFGLNDLALAVEVVRELGVAFGVVINKAGLGDERVADYCRREGIPVLFEMAFDRRYASCYAHGGVLIDEFPELKAGLDGLWRQITGAMRRGNGGYTS